MKTRSIREAQVPGTSQVVVPLDGGGPFLPEHRAAPRDWRTVVSTTFQPLGLWVKGATEESFITRVLIGNRGEVMLEGHPVPARYFETFRSFEELAELARAGELDDEVALAQIFEMRQVEPGGQIRVSTKGPIEAVCFWGLIEDGSMKRRTVEVRAVEGTSEYQGRIVEENMTGPQVLFVVRAPDSDDVVRLLQMQLGCLPQ